MEKLNIAELLKDCPKGTKLYSPLVGECTLERIHGEFKKIIISTSDGTTLTFNYNGTYFQMDNSECLLFPSKDQRDWGKFQKPFKDGDIISNGLYVAIFHKTGKPENCVKSNVVYYYCWYNKKYIYNKFKAKKDFGIGIIKEYKYATEEEKSQLFQAIKDNGYKWNFETKTLEKLPKFKVGDKIVKKDNSTECWYVQGVDTNCNLDYFYHIVAKGKIANLHFKEQDDWELVPNKFDINTLKPFESRVLVRNHNHHYWRISFFGFFDKNKCVYDTIRGIYSQCIPYEGNEHLCGTTNDCDEFYKNW